MNGEITFGILCLLVVIWHEYSWWRKRDWRRSFGKITGAEERKRRGKNRNSISYHPVIEYEISTGVSQFSSKYGSSIKPKINSQTRITISPDEQKAEQVYTYQSLAFHHLSTHPCPSLHIQGSRPLIKMNSGLSSHSYQLLSRSALQS